MDVIFDDRIGRLVSLGRAALAVGSLAAIWIDPAHSTPAAYVLLVAYAGFSLAIAALQMAYRLHAPIWGLAAHLVDLLVFAALLYLTDGPNSPFFPLLVFGLLAAMLRWQWRGVLGTTVALLAVYALTGLALHPEMLTDTAGTQQFIIRTLQLAVIGGLLTAFCIYHGRISREVMRINTAAPQPADDDVVPIEACLAYAAHIYNTDRVVLAWSDGQEPWLFLSEWRDGVLDRKRVPPDQLDPIVTAALRGRPFVYRRGRTALYGDDRGRLIRSRDTTINPAFIERFDIRHAIVLPVVAHGVEGWMFIVVDRALPSEALAIAPVLDAQIAGAFDKAAARAATSRASAAEQRLSLARDLHDGVLQFLAGLAMQIESIVDSDDVDTERLEGLRNLQDVLLIEQRELRNFIRRLRPGATQLLAGELQLRPDLTALVGRLQNQWRVNINLSVQPPDVTFPTALHYDIHQLAREAVANAVRHGHSRWINITANRENGVLHLSVSDDGEGLGLHGTFDDQRLAELKIGPRSLRERVSVLGGTISVTSSSLGTLVSMAVPLDNHGGRHS